MFKRAGEPINVRFKYTYFYCKGLTYRGAPWPIGSVLSSGEFGGSLLVGRLHRVDRLAGEGDSDLHNVANSVVVSISSAWPPQRTLGNHEVAGISHHGCHGPRHLQLSM